MHVEIEGLCAGASTSYQAGDRAHAGATRLAETVSASSIFGDFEEARAFQRVVSDAQTHHVDRMTTHQEQLGEIAAKAYSAAVAFTETEAHNSETVLSVPV